MTYLPVILRSSKPTFPPIPSPYESLQLIETMVPEVGVEPTRAFRLTGF